MHARLEDKTTISRFMANDFVVDQSIFMAKFTRYANPFISNFLALITECEGIVAAKFFVTQIKTLTHLMNVTTLSIRGDLDDIEMMAINAGANLNMDWKEMGFKDVRACITSKNMEGLNVAMNVLNANIGENETVLTAEGMTVAIWDGMKSKVAQVKLMNEQQDAMMAEKAVAVEAYNEKFEQMWAITVNIARAGKVLFNTLSIAKAKEYSVSAKLKRIRHDGTSAEEKSQKLAEQLLAKIGELVLTVKDFGIADSFIEDAEVEIVGTDIKALTDEDGIILLDLKEGTYSVIVRKDTYIDIVLNDVVIKAGETIMIDLEMKAAPVEPLV